MAEQMLTKKPLRLWEWREYNTGCLIENGIALNETGTFIWKLCDGKTTVTEIIDALCRQFDIRHARAQKDVIALIKLLIAENALKLKI